MRYLIFDEAGPFAIAPQVNKSGLLEVVWENQRGEVESKWLTREQAAQMIEILSRRFKLRDSQA